MKLSAVHDEEPLEVVRREPLPDPIAHLDSTLAVNDDREQLGVGKRGSTPGKQSSKRGLCRHTTRSSVSSHSSPVRLPKR